MSQPLTYQQIFSHVKAALIAQGKPSTKNTACAVGYCAYRGDDGCKCAIGHLISDQQIDKYGIREGFSAANFPVELIQELVVPQGNYSGAFSNARNSVFLAELQRAHDRARTAESFENIPFLDAFRGYMNNIAVKWGLEDI